MSKGFTVDVEGMAAFRKRLERLADDVRKGAETALGEAAQSVRDDMRKGVPVDTGALRDSLTARVMRGELTAEIGPLGKEFYYAHYVEFGHSSMPAQPFIGPAAELERRRFPDRLRKHVGKHMPK
ncbi:HK97-gp10 family putative phage morphogenesis protein [Nocardiopsis alba]|uniref:HK97-gp10 family putative phage morphogenesis protein n=1 Tax=Nocardiopsis alba TaxID=53437 RepID=UPI003D736CD3